MKKRKVLAVTGIRSEYDILYPVIKVLSEDESFDVKLVVCGAHLSEWHGYTVKKIKEDGFEIVDYIDYLLMTNRDVQRAKGVGILTYALAQTAERENPDFLLVVGDREESIATAIVGNYMKILTAHIGGGDPVYGNADDPIRFAVSKLSHLHFVTAKEYAENLKKVGEENFRIFWVGNPAYYNIHNTPKIELDVISDFLSFDIRDSNYIVIIKHPLSSQKEFSSFQMKVTLEAVQIFCEKSKFKAIGIYPNTDPGSYDILDVINQFSNSEYIRFYKTLPREIFINVMRNTKCLVGNSSMGLLEAPFYKIPVVNIGDRQKGRLNAGNVEFVPYDIDKIIKAIENAVFNQEYISRIKNIVNPFGDETAPFKIRDILKEINIQEDKWYVKRRLI